MAAARAGSRLLLGLDASTQSLKATAIESDTLKAVFTAAVNYDTDLPRYGTKGGFTEAAGGRVTSPAVMWVDALDTLLGRMKDSDFPFASVAAVSGSGQQHGSVYWRGGAASTLAALEPRKPLAAQLAGAFAVADSPIWADSSTTAQCIALEEALGGPLAVAELTGSRAYERFTGNQIAKIASDDRAAYEATERVSLVSSFMASLLIGGYAPIDYSDGAGMNLMDLRKREWSTAALEATAPDLARRLGEVVPSHAVVGPVGRYLVDTYGFDEACQVVAWSGDNPCSVAGLGLRQPGDIGISLGTSDTLFGITAAPTPGIEGHLFPNPVDPDSYMAMVCYKNGSLSREAVRDAVAGGDWDTFNALLAGTPKGNSGYIGFFVSQPEITPDIPTTGTYRFDPVGEAIEKFPDAGTEARAAIEGTAMSLRVHAASVGIVAPKRVLVTGGASANTAVTQVLADVFGVPVMRAPTTDSASLGAALRAGHGLVNMGATAGRDFLPYDVVVGTKIEDGYALASEPDMEAHALYSRMLADYKAREAVVVAGAKV